jgi:tetratricopeptide (TPR) repeat protein
MRRSTVSPAFSLTTATVVLLGGWAMPIYAQTATPTTPPAAERKTISEEVQAALGRLSQNDPAGAFKILDDAAKRNPALPSAYVLMYQCQIAIGRPDLARLELEAAIDNDPRDPEPWVLLGRIALQERRIAEATNDFGKALDLLGSYANADRKKRLEPEVLSEEARVAEFREKWKDAESILRELLKRDGNNLIVHQRLARSLFQQGKAKEAYDALKHAKEIDRAYSRQNKTRESLLTPEAIMAQYFDSREGPMSKAGTAEKWYKAAIEHAPGDLHTRRVVGMWALTRGDLALAKQQADEALKIEASDPAYNRSSVGRELRGLIALWEKKWDDAEQNFRSIILEAPNDFIAKNNLALALCEQDDKTQRALDFAVDNYRNNQSSPDALSTLGWVYFKRGDFDQAERCLNMAIKLTGGRVSTETLDTLAYWAHFEEHANHNWNAKVLLEGILKNDRPFSMRPEALKLYEKVKNAKKPESTSTTLTP